MVPGEEIVVRNLSGIAVLLFSLAAVGCGVSQAQLDKAKSLVEQGLEEWKKGGSPGNLKALPVPIEFYETAWSGSEALTSYEVKPATYHAPEKVIRCAAKLVLRNKRGKDRTENVVYDVILGPPAKINNNPMP